MPVFGQLKLKRFLPSKKRRPSYIIIPIFILVAFAIMAIFAPLLAPHSPTEPDLSLRYQPPFWNAQGSMDYPLGTDSLGRDILSRLLYGARVSISFALLGISIAGIIGTVLGLIAGYYGSWVDIAIMRLVDLTISVPFILLAMAMVVVLGQSYWNMLFIVSVLFWAMYARMARGETLSVKEKDFVALAKISGVSSPIIIVRHIFPNVVNSLVVLATLQIGTVILFETALSFLGVGIPPPAPTWGSMISDGRNALSYAWWVTTFPGVAIGAVVLSFNLLGDWLRDKLDPRLRQL